MQLMATIEESVKATTSAFQLIDAAASHEGVMIDIEWNRRVYYQIDCSYTSLINHIPVLICKKREDETMEECLVRSYTAFGEWLTNNAELYKEALHIHSDDGAEVLHRLRETFIQQ